MKKKTPNYLLLLEKFLLYLLQTKIIYFKEEHHLVSKELQKYNIDIATLNERSLSEEDDVQKRA